MARRKEIQSILIIFPFSVKKSNVSFTKNPVLKGSPLKYLSFGNSFLKVFDLYSLYSPLTSDPEINK